MGGDFNCVTDVDLDRSHTISKTDSSVNKLRNTLNNFQLKDIWKQHNPDKKEFTFYSNVGTGSRLDKFHLTKDLTSNVTESKIQNFAHSDHNKVTIKLDLSEIERGPGIWKINNSYLHDPEYVEEITRMWYLHQLKRIKMTISAAGGKKVKQESKKLALISLNERIKKIKNTALTCVNSFITSRTS